MYDELRVLGCRVETAGGQFEGWDPESRLCFHTSDRQASNTDSCTPRLRDRLQISRHVSFSDLRRPHRLWLTVTPSTDD